MYLSIRPERVIDTCDMWYEMDAQLDHLQMLKPKDI